METANISEFIRSQISKFPKIDGVSASYCYDAEFEIHLVVISPSVDRFKHNDIIKWEGEFWSSYFNNYSNYDMAIGTKEDFELYSLNEIFSSNTYQENNILNREMIYNEISLQIETIKSHHEVLDDFLLHMIDTKFNFNKINCNSNSKSENSYAFAA